MADAQKARLAFLGMRASYAKGVSDAVRTPGFGPNINSEEFRAVVNACYSDKESSDENLFNSRMSGLVKRWIRSTDTVDALVYISCQDAVTRRTLCYVSVGPDYQASFDKKLSRVIIPTLVAYGLVRVDTFEAFKGEGVEVDDNAKAGKLKQVRFNHTCYSITDKGKDLLEELEAEGGSVALAVDEYLKCFGDVRAEESSDDG